MNCRTDWKKHSSRRSIPLAELYWDLPGKPCCLDIGSYIAHCYVFLDYEAVQIKGNVAVAYSFFFLPMI